MSEALTRFLATVALLAGLAQLPLPDLLGLLAPVLHALAVVIAVSAAAAAVGFLIGRNLNASPGRSA